MGAQSPYLAFEGKIVRNIQFDPVQQPLEADELHDILPLQIGQPLRMATIRDSIDRLFRTGRYEDIQVDAQPYQDGVVIRFITRNSWFIGDVNVQGAPFHSAECRAVGERHPPRTRPAL